MKKLALAGIALGLVGAVAFAGVRIGVYGVCPLTGQPLSCSKSMCPPTPDCLPGDPRCSEDGAAAGDVSAMPQDGAPASAQSARTKRRCCDEVADENRPKAEAAPQPSTNP